MSFLVALSWSTRFTGVEPSKCSNLDSLGWLIDDLRSVMMHFRQSGSWKDSEHTPLCGDSIFVFTFILTGRGLTYCKTHISFVVRKIGQASALSRIRAYSTSIKRQSQGT